MDQGWVPNLDPWIKDGPHPDPWIKVGPPNPDPWIKVGRPIAYCLLPISTAYCLLPIAYVLLCRASVCKLPGDPSASLVDLAVMCIDVMWL